jgi:hypothetical protein
LKATWWLDPSMIAGYSWWRVRVPARRLPGAIVHAAEYEPGRQEGAAAVFRSLLETDRELKAIREAKRAGVRVLLDIEDNHLGEDKPDLVTVKSNGVPSALSIFRPPVPRREQVEQVLGDRNRRHNEAVALADGLIVTTPALQSVYAFHPDVYVCANAVDPDDWPALEKPDDGIFRVGFAGSPSHADDVPLIGDALRWASQQPDVEVILLGFNPRLLTWREARRQQELQRKERIVEWENGEPINGVWAFLRRVRERQEAWSFAYRQLPIMYDYDDYRRALALFDVGLCPLVETDWSRCRSDSKALEYAMAGALPLCSNAEPYRGWRWPLVDDAAGFAARLAWCLENRDQVRVMAAELRDAVLAERTISGMIAGWRAAVRAA